MGMRMGSHGCYDVRDALKIKISTKETVVNATWAVLILDYYNVIRISHQSADSCKVSVKKKLIEGNNIEKKRMKPKLNVNTESNQQ